MIALVPHIIRTPDYTPENLRGVFSGPDQSLRLMYGPRDDDGSAPATVPAGTAANPAPAAAPQTPVAVPVIPGVPANAPPPVPPAAGTRVVFLPGSVSVGANTPFTVNVELNGAADAFAVTPLRVKWDPAVLRLTDITPGDLLSRSGGAVSSIKDVRNDAGEATLNVSGARATAGVSGSGPVAILNFVAMARGNGIRYRDRDGAEKCAAAAAPGDAGRGFGGGTVGIVRGRPAWPTQRPRHDSGGIDRGVHDPGAAVHSDRSAGALQGETRQGARSALSRCARSATPSTDIRMPSDQQKIQVKVGTDGYPEDLNVLVEGVTLVGNATGSQDQVPAPHSDRSHDQDHRLGQAQLAGRSEVKQLGRTECFRCLQHEHGAGTRWNSLFRVAVSGSAGAATR